MRPYCRFTRWGGQDPARPILLRPVVRGGGGPPHPDRDRHILDAEDTRTDVLSSEISARPLPAPMPQAPLELSGWPPPGYRDALETFDRRTQDAGRYLGSVRPTLAARYGTLIARIGVA